jgi:hypothetical protein
MLGIYSFSLMYSEMREFGVFRLSLLKNLEQRNSVVIISKSVFPLQRPASLRQQMKKYL